MGNRHNSVYLPIWTARVSSTQRDFWSLGLTKTCEAVVLRGVAQHAVFNRSNNEAASLYVKFKLLERGPTLAGGDGRDDP